MKIKTNAGEVELTAEMARRGMVLETSWWSAVVTVGVDGWTENHIAEDPAACLLGCDPAIAAREDCERYGIAPGIDAGAHGFARLRDGGAVDLRRDVVPGMCLHVLGVGRVMYSRAANLLPTDRFVGLDARHARPEDVERLCCGTMRRRRAAWEASHCGARPKPGQTLTDHHGGEQPANGDERCTKNKGCDGRHVDHARGETWTDDAPMVTCARCAAPVIPTPERPPMYVVAQDETGNYRRGAVCEGCAKIDGDVVWRGDRLVPKQARKASEPGKTSPEAERHRKEAPLVALVNDVPDGLDATGWRAAVLAVEERRHTQAVLSHHASAATLCRLLDIVAVLRRGHITDGEDGLVQVAALGAYRRAIAPHKAPPPERRRGGRDVRLVVDDGRDE